MVIGVLVCLFAVGCYLFLLGASQGRDWAQEDREQEEYLKEYCFRKQQKRKNK